MTTFISIRVSTREQSTDGASLPIQVRECMAYCRQSGFELHPTATNVDQPGVFADPGVSAWKVPIFQRPGFRSLWNHVHRGDQIVFLSFDRAFRSTKDFLDSFEVMKSTGVSPVFVRNNIRMDTAAGQLWARTIASFAEYQSAIISERVREANAIRKLYGITKSSRSRRGSQSEIEIPDNIRRLYQPKDVDSRPDSQSGRVFAYARVSTAEQDAETQIRSLESGIEYRMMNGYSRGGLFLDNGVSAFFNNFANRPAGSKIWSQLERGDVILCTKLDRMFRSTLDMAQVLQVLNEKGVTISTLDGSISTETPEGQAIASYLCIMAQWESQSISWRVKLAMDAIRRERGPWLNQRQMPRWIRPVPLESGGYRLQIVPEIIRDAIAMRELKESGLTAMEVSDVMQRRHEEAEGLPVAVPRAGFESRWMVEQRLRAKGRFDDLKKLRDYCERFRIGLKDTIDRYYSITAGDVGVLLQYTQEDALMGRYMEENEADVDSIMELAGGAV